MRAQPKRVSSGGTSRIDERMPSGRRIVFTSKVVSRCSISTTPVPKSASTRLPMARNSSRMRRASVISGTRSSRTGSWVSKVAARIGSTAFLLAEGRMAPLRGAPPWTMRSDMFRFRLVGWLVSAMSPPRVNPR